MEDEWWGVDIKCPSDIAVSAKNQTVTLDMPDVTGLEGDMYAPTIFLTNFPDKSINDLIKGHLVKLRVDTLIVNGQYVAGALQFGKSTQPDKLRLRINGQDILPSQELAAPTLQIPLQEHNGTINKADFLKNPVPLLRQMFKVVEGNVDTLKDAGHHQWRMTQGIKIHGETEHSHIFSRILIFGQDRRQVRGPQGNYWESGCFYAHTSENFKEMFKKIQNYFDYFSSNAKMFSTGCESRKSTVWMRENDLFFFETDYFEKVRKAVKSKNSKKALNVRLKPAFEVNNIVHCNNGQIALGIRFGTLKQCLKPKDFNRIPCEIWFYTAP